MHPAFEHIIGQTNAKKLLSLSINSAKNEGDLVQPLFFGEAGLGKTELARSYGNAVAEELGVEMIEYATPKDFRLVDDFDPFLDRLIGDPKFVVYIDECHEMDFKMPSHAKFNAYLRKALDRQNTGKLFQIADRVSDYDRTKKVIILATNHPNKVDTAIRSRMNVINLSTYNMKQMKEIARLILSKNDMEVDCEQTLDRIASCGRGTARPIVKLVMDVFKLMNISTVDNAIAMSGLQMLDMYPAGLDSNEVKLLDVCKDQKYTRMQIVSVLSGLRGTFSESIAYLIQKNLLFAGNGGFKTTVKGRKYLKYIDEEGFVW